MTPLDFIEVYNIRNRFLNAQSDKLACDSQMMNFIEVEQTYKNYIFIRDMSTECMEKISDQISLKAFKIIDIVMRNLKTFLYFTQSEIAQATVMAARALSGISSKYSESQKVFLKDHKNWVDFKYHAQISDGTNLEMQDIKSRFMVLMRKLQVLLIENGYIEQDDEIQTFSETLIQESREASLEKKLTHSRLVSHKPKYSWSNI